MNSSGSKKQINNIGRLQLMRYTGRDMMWTAVSGSWRTYDERVERDVRDAVDDVIDRGDGIVTGGALGVDCIATDQVLKRDKSAQRLKIFLPSSLDVYSQHYNNRAAEGVITPEQAAALIGQLTLVRLIRPEALVEMHHTKLNPTTYYDRNTQVIAAADELLAFRVNSSQGVTDAIAKSENLGLTVTVYDYTIDT